MFKKLEGDTAVIVSKGKFKQCDLYTYQGQLFAKDGSGFVRVNRDGSTSVSGVRVETLAYEAPLFADRFGRLCIEGGDGRTAVLSTPQGIIEAQPKTASLSAPSAH